MRADQPSQPSVLFVANFPAGTGYAWDSIEATFAGVADRLMARGVRTFVSYPALNAAPATLAGSPATAVALDASLGSLASVRAVADFVRREQVRVIYFTDRAAMNLAYPVLRRAGVRRIMVHKRTVGAATSPYGWRQAAKWLLARLPGVVADRVVAVSRFVANRQITVGLVPAARVVTISNGVPAALVDTTPTDRLRTLIGAPPGHPIIAAASRAVPEKGIAQLLLAFDAIYTAPDGLAPLPHLVFIGEGPGLAAFRELRATLASRDAIHLVGYQTNAGDLLGGAAIVVVPSLCEEAFGNTIIEGMARGCVVVATRVGGIPEVIDENAGGWLVDPGDVPGLAATLRRLLADPAGREAAGRTARDRVAQRFTRERQIEAITALLAPALD
jgi:glycosyltransferase involved in cell wall biosynthesis